MKETGSRWIQGLLRNISWVLLGVVATAGLYVYLQQAHDKAATRDCIQKYPLTSQDLDCDTYQESASSLRSLDQALDSATALYVQEGKAKRVSVWVRDLETLQWASSDENDRYAPASLLKLPLMITYFKLAQLEPTLLDTQLVYEPSTELSDSSQDFAPQHPLIAGKSYSVRELIENMIVESDNGATAVLVGHIDQNILTNTMIDLGIEIPGSSTTYNFVTAKTYANIFRALYNGSYLDREYSEKALELMASSTFKALAQPLPTGTTVADKFGEREVDDAAGNAVTRELHDCGIIYKGSSPYTICIMTEGSDFSQLLSIIHDISALTYKNI